MLKLVSSTEKTQWANIQTLLKKRLGQEVFDAWFKSLRPADFDEAKRHLKLEVANVFVLNCLKPYFTKIEDACKEIYGENVNVTVHIHAPKAVQPPENTKGVRRYIKERPAVAIRKVVATPLIPPIDPDEPLTQVLKPSQPAYALAGASRLTLIIEETAVFFNLSVDEIESASSMDNVVEAQRVAMYFAQMYTSVSFSDIGMRLGQRGPESAEDCIDLITLRSKTDTGLKAKLAVLQSRIIRKLK